VTSLDLLSEYLLAMAFVPASESACPSQDASCLPLSIVPNAEVSVEIHSAASLEWIRRPLLTNIYGYFFPKWCSGKLCFVGGAQVRS